MISGALFVGGDPPFPTAVSTGFADLTIAADSGYALATALGRRVDVLVGDLDSIDSESLLHAESSGVDIRRHPAQKDDTDFELAIHTAAALGIDRLLIVGGLGGRLDHLIGIIERMRCLRSELAELQFMLGEFHGFVLAGGDHIELATPCQFSVLPGPDGATVSIDGATWNVEHSPFAYGSGRGLSNIAAAAGATVNCHHGSAIVLSSAVTPTTKDER